MGDQYASLGAEQVEGRLWPIRHTEHPNAIRRRSQPVDPKSLDRWTTAHIPKIEHLYPNIPQLRMHGF